MAKPDPEPDPLRPMTAEPIPKVGEILLGTPFYFKGATYAKVRNSANMNNGRDVPGFDYVVNLTTWSVTLMQKSCQPECVYGPMKCPECGSMV